MVESQDPTFWDTRILPDIRFVKVSHFLRCIAQSGYLQYASVLCSEIWDLTAEIWDLTIERCVINNLGFDAKTCLVSRL